MGDNSVKIDWLDPLNFAQKVAANYSEESWILLYSGLNNKIKNSSSYIAVFPEEKIICDDFSSAEKIIKSSDKKWFGYFAYEVGSEFEKLPKTKKSFVDLPKIWLNRFAVVLEFNHEKRSVTATYSDKKKLDKVLKWTQSCDGVTNIELGTKSSQIVTPSHDGVQSNFTDKSYLAAISDIREKISIGEFYQTNLTRKFFGEFTQKQNQQQAFQLFSHLTKLSPANYSSFLKLGDNYVISSSPELFLSAKNGKILSRPIKGTAPRGSTLAQDRKNKSLLKNSIKECAENLMIVDLVRNDLSRICKAGSVVVKKLFAITSYQNIHHMSSEIHGKIAENFCAFDAIRSCFPAGSMTGAPKIKAAEIAAKKEKLDRGIYSGTIGIFSRDEINSSVVIRTLVLRGKKFEFQVGGAITFDSDPKSELEEIFNKARGILKLLKIKL